MNRIITNTKTFLSRENLNNLNSFHSNEWIQYLKFNHQKYSRNLVFENDFYKMYVLCWLPRQKTPIHDHPGNGCMFKIVQGELEETLYDGNSNLLATKTHYVDDFTSIKNKLHAMENKSNNYSVSLHIYSE